VNKLVLLLRRLFAGRQRGLPRHSLTVKPRADWVLFKALVINRKSGIVVPEGTRLDQDLVKNIVFDVGPRVFNVRPGDEIIILPHARLKISMPGRDVEPDLFLVKEQEICAVIFSR